MNRLLAANTWIWASPIDDAMLAELARKAADMGYTALELPVENIDDWDANRARDVLDEHGLGAVVVGAMGAGRSLVAAHGDVAATVEYLSACAHIAATVGAHAIGGPFYAPTGVTWRMSADERIAAYAEVRQGLARVADVASNLGVGIAIEPLNRYETSLINTVAQAIDALEPLFDHGVGLALDTYHLGIEERSTAGALRAASDALLHVQVCGNDRGPVGADQTDWTAVMGALEHYTGVIGVESFTPDNATIAVAASIWRPLAESPDALAKQSIDYLRAIGADTVSA